MLVRGGADVGQADNVRSESEGEKIIINKKGLREKDNKRERERERERDGDREGQREKGREEQRKGQRKEMGKIGEK